MTTELGVPLAGVGQDGRHLYTCPLCEAMCGLEIQVADGKVAGIRGNRDDTWSHGHLCPKGATLGELHIMVWSGTVARRGATRHTKGAKLVSELTLKPIEPPEGGNIWRATDGVEYSTESLVTKCFEMLREHAGEGEERET